MPARSTITRIALAGAGVLAPAVAWAHTGVGSTSGFAHGFGHPVTGLDHVLTMVAVGVLAAHLGGRALWSLPLTFATVMVIGCGLAIFGVPIPFVETGIAVSVVVLGIVVALRWRWPAAAATVLVALFAIFHGHAHGSEMPIDISAVEYAVGFLLATAILHAAGLGIGIGAIRTGQRYSPRLMQAGGLAMALTGVAILTGMV